MLNTDINNFQELINKVSTKYPFTSTTLVVNTVFIAFTQEETSLADIVDFIGDEDIKETLVVADGNAIIKTSREVFLENSLHFIRAISNL